MQNNPKSHGSKPPCQFLKTFSLQFWDSIWSVSVHFYTKKIVYRKISIKMSKKMKKIDDQFLVVLSNDLSKIGKFWNLACLEAFYFGFQKIWTLSYIFFCSLLCIFSDSKKINMEDWSRRPKNHTPKPLLLHENSLFRNIAYLTPYKFSFGG